MKSNRREFFKLFAASAVLSCVISGSPAAAVPSKAARSGLPMSEDLFGLNGVCDACQVCVRRCPTGAIPLRRAAHRGITKSKIKLDRCLPVVGQAQGCAVCMKVCPVQKYGLDDVLAHYERTGEILGKGTDELEGYTWPLDGRTYGAGQKPRIDTQTLLRPPDLVLDPTRTEPRDAGPLRLG